MLAASVVTNELCFLSKMPRGTPHPTPSRKGRGLTCLASPIDGLRSFPYLPRPRSIADEDDFAVALTDLSDSPLPG